MSLTVYIGFAQPDEWCDWAATYARHARRFEEAGGGQPCLVIPFYHVSAPLMQRLCPQAVLLSGFARSFEEYAPESFLGVTSWIEQTDTPILAMCGSHQLLGFLFNGRFDGATRLCDEPMRPLRPGEPVTNPDYHPDYFMERGFYPLQLTGQGRADLLFAGLGPTPYLYESHYCEVKARPPGFELLASTPECRIQAMRHKQRPLYGVQFHPEDYRLEPTELSAGRKLLENFFRLAADYWSQRESSCPI